MQKWDNYWVRGEKKKVGVKTSFPGACGCLLLEPWAAAAEDDCAPLGCVPGPGEPCAPLRGAVLIWGVGRMCIPVGSELCLLGSARAGAGQPPHHADPRVLDWVCCLFTKIQASLGNEALGRGAAQNRAAVPQWKDFIQVGGKLEVADK